jgi:hypothetical protein
LSENDENWWKMMEIFKKCQKLSKNDGNWWKMWKLSENGGNWWKLSENVEIVRI